MNKFLALALLSLACNCNTPYDRAIKRCIPKCAPNIVHSVDYNFNNNRYDKCICNTKLTEKELEDETE